MPNHLHAIIWILDSSKSEASAMLGDNNRLFISADASPQQRPIGTQPGSLGAIIQNFKSISTRRIHQWYQAQGKGEAFTPLDFIVSGSIPVNASPQRVWQRNYYEHIVRNESELERIQQYIVGNPFQWSMDEENPDRIG